MLISAVFLSVFGTVVGGFGCGLVSVVVGECGWLVVVCCFLVIFFSFFSFLIVVYGYLCVLWWLVLLVEWVDFLYSNCWDCDWVLL